MDMSFVPNGRAVVSVKTMDLEKSSINQFRKFSWVSLRETNQLLFLLFVREPGIIEF